MTKTSKTLSLIAYALGCLLGLLVFWAFISLADEAKDNTAETSELKARVTSLEQELKTTREALDAQGVVDLNL